MPEQTKGPLILGGHPDLTVAELLRQQKPDVVNSVLIIGGGIAGIQAVLDVAEAGFTAYIVESEPSLGGKMAMLDKTFPTNDCSICMGSPKMLDTVVNTNIQLLTYAEIKEVKGSVGDFTVLVTEKARHVRDDCTACGKCEEVCIVKAPSEFDQGMVQRKAIYLPFPYAVPRVFTLDMDNCRKYGGGCRACIIACRDEEGKNCIDFWQRPKTRKLHVGSIIVATGYEMLNPSVIPEYGYGEYKNVITGLQFERLLNATGPTGGKIQRPSDGERPQKIAFIQCVASRDARGRTYCSKVCCMYATKQAVLTKEHYPDLEVYIFYIDRRFYGKGHWSLYRRAAEMGVRYIRSRPSKIVELSDHDLKIKYENSETGQLEETRVGMIVLSTSLVPPRSNEKLSRILGISLDESSFFKEVDPLTRPFETEVEGIYICGFCREPADISESVAQASGAAAKAVSALIKSGAGREQK
jgi:heterodisulfide reductase subunit A